MNVLPEFVTSPTAPDVALLPTNAWCASSVPLYLHGLLLPFLQSSAAVAQWWPFVSSVQLSAIEIVFAPGVLSAIAPPELDHRPDGLPDGGVRLTPFAL